MLHPFFTEIWQEEHGEDLSSLSMEKLHEKISEINKRITYARSYGQWALAQQLEMLMQELYSISQERMRTEIERQEKERRAKMEKAKKELDL